MSDPYMKDFIDGFVEAARSGGRASTVQVYEAGKHAALSKYAGLSLHDGADLAGLSLLAAPLIHDVATQGKKDSPGMHRAKKITELAGLAALAASTLTKLH